MNLPLQNLDLVKGEDNQFDLDLATPVDIDAGDDVIFRAKYSKSDTDANAVLTKKRSVGPAEIEITDPALGKARIKLLPVDTKTLVGRALVYDVKLKKVDVTPDVIQTVAHGVIRMIESVDKDTV